MNDNEEDLIEKIDWSSWKTTAKLQLSLASIVCWVLFVYNIFRENATSEGVLVFFCLAIVLSIIGDFFDYGFKD